MDESLEGYQKYLRYDEKSSKTIDKYMRDVRRFLDFSRTWNSDGSGGNLEVTKELVMAYKMELVKKYQPSSVNSMLAALNNYLGYMNRTDCRVKLLKIQRKVFYDKSKELRREEYLKLVQQARRQGNERLALIMETICGTGIRISELHHVTLEAVKAGVSQVSCKGKERVILIPERLQEKLMSYCKAREIKEGSVFITRTGAPMDRSNVWREMKELCLKSGIYPDKVFPHNMRHLFARTYYKKQKDIVHLADILGHSSIETTRIYTMTSCNEYEKQINGMELIV